MYKRAGKQVYEPLPPLMDTTQSIQWMCICISVIKMAAANLARDQKSS